MYSYPTLSDITENLKYNVRLSPYLNIFAVNRLHKKTPNKTIRSEKNVGVKDAETQIYRRAEITGRFVKRFSGERPDPLGFEFSLFTEFKRVVWRVIDRQSAI